MKPLLELRGATKKFRGIAAIQSVDFTLNRGEIHAVVGENGAGKSTLTKTFAGIHTLTSGEMFFEGEPVTLGSPSDGLRLGIAMVFQETNLIPAMTVAQNLHIGNESLFNNVADMNNDAYQLLAKLNFQIDPTVQVGVLGAAHKQMVEIARAIRYNAKVIVFDEPTATLTPAETSRLFKLMRQLVETGVAIVFISHALEEALEISNRITVLRDGKLAVTGPTEEFDRDRLIRSMVGRSLSGSLHGGKPKVPRTYGRKLLSAANLSSGTAVRDSSFTLYEGQITGLFGLVGSGRTEMMKIIAGALQRDARNGGTVSLRGKSVRFDTPREAMKAGIVYVTEDRKLEGFFETMSIAENIQIGDVARGSNPIDLVTRAQALSLAKEWTQKLAIKAIDANARVIELSGGNQQKVVIAKSLVQKPELVIFDEPTRGVDVGAIAEIHQLIEELADAGIAVVVISSYIPEILAVSDRILIARQGRIVEEVDRATANEENIMYAAAH